MLKHVGQLWVLDKIFFFLCPLLLKNKILATCSLNIRKLGEGKCIPVCRDLCIVTVANPGGLDTYFILARLPEQLSQQLTKERDCLGIKHEVDAVIKKIHNFKFP